MAYKASPQTLARAALARSKMSKKIRDRSGETAPLSVKKASIKTKPTVRAAARAAASAAAYGATKGLAVGGEHGGAGVAQKSGEVKIYTPAEIEAINKERGTMPVELSPEEKRKNMIKAAVERAAAKKARSFDVPILPNPAETNSVADMLGAHLALHITGNSMDEEVEQIDERNLENKKKKNNWVRGLGVRAAIRGDVPFDRGHSPLRSGREVLAREDIMNEEPKDAADAGEYDYEGDMAKSQLRSIMANSKRLHDMLEENTNLPEWVQSKITLAQDYIQTAASYMEAEMNEETKLDSVGREDADVDNDGDSDNTDNYLKKKRAAINMAIFSRIRNKTGK